MAGGRRRIGTTETGTVLLVALGAVAGLAIGMAIADRVGGVEGLLRRTGSARQRRHRDDGWRGDERRSQPFDEFADDESELAPEAISHLHLRGRYPEPAPRPSSARPSRPAPPLDPVTAASSATAAPAAPAAAASGLDAEEIEARVLALFCDDPQLATLNIDIGADDDGRVELTGWVPDEEALIHALAVVRGIPGVREVLNGLAIEPTVPR